MSIEVDHDSREKKVRVILTLEQSIPQGCVTFWLSEEQRLELIEKLKNPAYTVQVEP